MAMNKLDKETAIALAKNNMNTTDTAMSLGVHRNTVLFRIERMKDRTGLDAKNFYDLHKLVSVATGKDMQEVVRCKDCKSWEQYTACDGTKPHRCMNYNAIFYKRTAPDDFCSCGERRTDETL